MIARPAVAQHQEVDGKGYLVVLGGGNSYSTCRDCSNLLDQVSMYVDVTLACAVGGTGNILDNFGVHDIGDVAVLAIESWKWIGHYRLSGDIIPGRHHTACRGIGNQLLVMGGGRRPSDKAQIITEFTDVWPLFVDILLIVGSCLLLGVQIPSVSFKKFQMQPVHFHSWMAAVRFHGAAFHIATGLCDGCGSLYSSCSHGRCFG